MTDRTCERVRSLLGVVAPAVLIGALGLSVLGCSSDAEPSAGSLAAAEAPVTAPETAAPVASASTPVTTTAPEATTLPEPTAAPAPPTVDGAAALQSAVANLEPGYHYHSTITVGGVPTLEADGDRVGSGTRLGVVRDGATVQYVITPEGTWVLPDGGDWDQLDTPAATADPITALGTPNSVSVVSASPETVSLMVSVPNAALGIAGDGAADLAVTITNGALTGVVYRSAVEGQEAIVETTVGPVVDGSEVVPPI
jgi:hypothetical protein